MSNFPLLRGTFGPAEANRGPSKQRGGEGHTLEASMNEFTPAVIYKSRGALKPGNSGERAFMGKFKLWGNWVNMSCLTNEFGQRQKYKMHWRILQ